jgi:hypothetical protein
MADTTQKQIDDLQKELDKIDKSITGLAATLNTNISLSLKSGLDNARKLTEEFDKGKNITKSLEKEIEKNGRKIEANFLREVRANAQRLAAQRSGNALQERLQQSKLTELSFQKQILIQTDAQLRQLEKISEEKQKQNNLGEVAKSQAKKILEPFKEMFTIAGIFKIIIDGALRFQKISVDIGKNLGYGADNADRVTSNLKNIAQSSNNVNVNLANVAGAMTELNDATRGVAIYSADALETQIMLTKQFGLTGEEAADIYKFSVLTGKSSSQVNKEMVATFANTRNAVKGSADFKKTIAEAAKVSGQLAANFRNNPGAITAAIVQMQALGTTLEQTKKQGESLLDFESSLESELKAELLTGKQLNLERARAAALAGDQVTLAEELRKNAGSLEDFQKMNVLAQKSLAEAMGMTTDELANQLNQQKIAQEQGKSLAQVQAEDLEKAQQRQDIQTKFNAAILKLQDFFGNLVAGPLGSFLNMLTKALDIITYIGVGLGTIYATSKAITITQALTTALKTEEAVATGTTSLLLGARTAIMSTQLGILVSQAAAAVIANPLLGLVGLAAAAGVGALVYSQMKDGIIGPGGETIVSGPAGSIQLDKNDSLVAGTNLFGGKNEGGLGGSSMSIDLTPMINAISEVRDAVNKLYSKEGIVSIDGKKVGTLLTQGSYKSA